MNLSILQALSSVYFVHESVQPNIVAIWDFQGNATTKVKINVLLHTTYLFINNN
jgi:hypothetical protein